MARPSYDKDQPTAKSRLKEAFWKLLAENRYSQITVKKLSSSAQVNTNTFYYHYDSMDDLAFDALNDEKLYEIPSIIRTGILSGTQLSLSEALEYIVIGERWKKIRLFITSDSTVLHQLFYDTMEQFWLSIIGVHRENLSEADALDLTFILHGAISIIQKQTGQYSLDFIKSLPDRPLGQGIMQTLENLMIKYQV